ncbi:hypothetical protein ACIGCP_19150 [Cellulophaga baltica]|uniref:hypothetical protein n=1 Tax=Cellulophaga baltica TaxID=76594 RepID=UPI0037C94916
MKIIHPQAQIATWIIPFLKPIAMASKEHNWAFATPVAIIASKLIVIHLQLN